MGGFLWVGGDLPGVAVDRCGLFDTPGSVFLGSQLPSEGWCPSLAGNHGTRGQRMSGEGGRRGASGIASAVPTGTGLPTTLYPLRSFDALLVNQDTDVDLYERGNYSPADQSYVRLYKRYAPTQCRSVASRRPPRRLLVTSRGGRSLALNWRHEDGNFDLQQQQWGGCGRSYYLSGSSPGVVWVDVSREGLGGRVPGREWGAVVALCGGVGVV